MKPHSTWLISLPDAVKMIKKMNIKKHRNAGYSFELEPIDMQSSIWNKPDKEFYATYKWGTVIYKLNIYYEKPE
jgi:hypothetical protein